MTDKFAQKLSIFPSKSEFRKSSSILVVMNPTYEQLQAENAALKLKVADLRTLVTQLLDFVTDAIRANRSGSPGPNICPL